MLVGGAPEGLDALLLAEIAAGDGEVLHVARDDARMAATAAALAVFSPGLEVLTLPAWDCLPYDRVSPNAAISSARMDVLSRLAREARPRSGPRVVLTTVNALLQRLPARDTVAAAAFAVEVGEAIDLEALMAFLTRDGYGRSGTVMEPGEVALRGGIVDIFPPGAPEPLRLDLFGDTVEEIRTFDPLSQLTTGKTLRLDLRPASEIILDEAAIARFRSGYRAEFGAVTDGDPLYAAISEGRRHIGMEHWLPLFHERLETLFDYLPEAAVTLDYLAEEARDARLETIADHFETRRSMRQSSYGEGSIPYKPLPPERLYLAGGEWQRRLAPRASAVFSPYRAPESDQNAIDAGGKRGRDFAPERARPEVNVFDSLREHVGELQAAGRRVLVTSFSRGSRERLALVLRDHGIDEVESADTWPEAARLRPGTVGLLVLGIEHGFETDELAVIGEQDILGDRLARPQPTPSRRAENFLSDASEINAGDLVVHLDHGVGRYQGLENIAVAGAPHDCLAIVYEGGDRLFLPVENIEMLSRYGAGDAEVALDRLGGAAWQSRKARLKKRIREIADELIRVAAQRELRPATVLAPPEGLYEEFSARFPFDETEDQRRAIGDVLDDLTLGHPMDRLICGDVGFGKTEVALRSAFVAVMGGKQVAVVTPNTLLCRQHYQTFRERFAGLPVRIGQLSRLVPQRQAAEVREGLADGIVDIVIGTHAILGKNVAFHDLGLLVVDEEQHFGVAHKEKLKQLKTDVHVLTLTATPIPRTLQMALSGVREMSLIATPPVDRLAIRTFIMPFDPMVVREAILREHYRGGQCFYVCPRIDDLPGVRRTLEKLVPEVKVATAHGRMAARPLEAVMNTFYDGGYDLLLSTSIIDSGLDIPTANTLVVHRADMFGLAQLYQLRGRIGRSKLRAYAYLTLPPRRVPTAGAERRLQVMQALDSLGAGFTLASHDMDIRGAGNLLGEEQSGHIREVGLELYQHLLEEAVAAARDAAGGAKAEAEDTWSPQIAIGTAVLIPETYVADLSLRLGLYRRLARLEERAEIDAFAAEMIDRFGPLPDEVEGLLKIVAIKGLCRQARVEKVEAGPRGATLSFKDDRVANPAGVVEFISARGAGAKLRPDHTLVWLEDWPTPVERVDGVHRLVKRLAEIAAQAPPLAADAPASPSSSPRVARSST